MEGPISFKIKAALPQKENLMVTEELKKLDQSALLQLLKDARKIKKETGAIASAAYKAHLEVRKVADKAIMDVYALIELIPKEKLKRRERQLRSAQKQRWAGAADEVQKLQSEITAIKHQMSMDALKAVLSEE